MFLRRWWFLILPPAIVVALVGFLINLLVPVVQRVGRPPGADLIIAQNIERLAECMRLYSEKHGSLPPPAVYSKEGQPLLSWRVLLLPHLGETALFSEFHLNEPWDSEHNLKLLPKMPEVFDSLIDRKASVPHTTSFRVFVGPGTAFEGRRGISPKDIPDGADRTLLIVEAAEAVAWTKPAELPYVPEGALPALGRRYANKFCAVYANTQPIWVQKSVAESALRAVITRNGREPWEPLGP